VLGVTASRRFLPLISPYPIFGLSSPVDRFVWKAFPTKTAPNVLRMMRNLRVGAVVILIYLCCDLLPHVSALENGTAIPRKCAPISNECIRTKSCDYTIALSACDGRSLQQRLTFQRKENLTCLQDVDVVIIREIPCSFVPLDSHIGSVALSVVCIVFVISAWFGLWLWTFRKTRLVKFSQPVFLLIFVIGCFSCVCSSLTLFGKNDLLHCQLRVWRYLTHFSCFSFYQ